ncbi:helix-turn-helix domain-containing protein [Thalassococcus lentus]|uniref:XRE family transcriptional regulator n=1 Tax=Thalassococcus lentus TaxID=1210524 RepID=A0ABT4XU08_9RHOB|nr:XRE family transcriptional regulator [Thalassococcus lentus]MDA7425293.1 XRE family transcriptional regulator [Thalassococcus lentus]
MTATLNQRLADCLSALRAQRGWTLDQLAGVSGVSRAALSRLENAEVSPSADVLWKLAGAHEMTLSRLMSLAEDGFTPHVRRDDQPTWRDENSGFTRRVVSPGSGSLGVEIVECKLPPGTELGYDAPPAAGQEHHLVMISGYMKVLNDEGSYDLGPGDSLRYKLYGPSHFVTAKGQGARYLMCLVG